MGMLPLIPAQECQGCSQLLWRQLSTHLPRGSGIPWLSLGTGRA